MPEWHGYRWMKWVEHIVWPWVKGLPPRSASQDIPLVRYQCSFVRPVKWFSNTAMHSLSLAPVWLLTARHAVEKSLSDVVESKPRDWEEWITAALHNHGEPEQYTYLQDKQKTWPDYSMPKIEFYWFCICRSVDSVKWMGAKSDSNADGLFNLSLKLCSLLYKKSFFTSMFQLFSCEIWGSNRGEGDLVLSDVTGFWPPWLPWLAAVLETPGPGPRSPRRPPGRPPGRPGRPWRSGVSRISARLPFTGCWSIWFSRSNCKRRSSLIRSCSSSCRLNISSCRFSSTSCSLASFSLACCADNSDSGSKQACSHCCASSWSTTLSCCRRFIWCWSSFSSCSSSSSCSL